MAEILEIGSLPRAGDQRVHHAKNSGVDAEIIIFPGVRYERESSTADKGSKRLIKTKKADKPLA